MKKKLQTYLLFTVCLLMQVVSVFPHHHHGDLFCFNMEQEICTHIAQCNDPFHHHPQNAEDTHACDATCITHIQCNPQDHSQVSVNPDYSFCTILYSLIHVTRLLYPDHTVVLQQSGYIEKLHPSPSVVLNGLRGPPFC